MIRLNWLLPRVHTTKLINCKYANKFFSLSVAIKEFCLNIKELKIVGQIVIYSYQSNTCMTEMFSCRTKCLLKFAQNEETVFVKDLSILLERFIWSN